MTTIDRFAPSTTIRCARCRAELETFARNRQALSVDLAAAGWRVTTSTSPDGTKTTRTMQCKKCSGGTAR